MGRGMKTASILLAVIGLLGAFDIAYFHWYKCRLASRPESRLEFWIHIARGVIYALQFAIVPNVRLHGAYYAAFDAVTVMKLAAYASRTENQDAIDGCVIGTLSDPTLARKGIKLLDFKPFNPVDKRTEITYLEESSGKLKRATKGMTGIIIELCSRNKTSEIEDQLENDVEEFARRGLRAGRQVPGPRGRGRRPRVRHDRRLR